MRIIKFKYRHTEKAHKEGKEWMKIRDGETNYSTKRAAKEQKKKM